MSEKINIEVKMIRLNTKIYNNKGVKLTLKEISKARFFSVANKKYGIDEYYEFFKPSKKEEKLDQIKLVKNKILKKIEKIKNKIEIDQQVTKNTVFELDNEGWSYSTYDQNGVELSEPVGRKSYHYALFKDGEFTYNDSFSTRDSKSLKLKLMNDIVLSYIETDKAIERTESKTSYVEAYYYSNKLESGATSHNIVTKFSKFPSWEEHKEALREEIMNQAKLAYSQLLTMKNGNNHLWQFLAMIVPVNEEGMRVTDHKQYISTYQLSNYKKAEGDMLSKVDSLERIFYENYSLDFDNAEMGFAEFTLCLIQSE